MTSEELKAKIKTIIPIVYNARKKVESKAVEYDELTKFPELKEVIVDLLTADFDAFLASIDWVAPRPTTFRINLKNGEDFYLIYNKRSWVAQVEGKKYYLLNFYNAFTYMMMEFSIQKPGKVVTRYKCP